MGAVFYLRQHSALCHCRLGKRYYSSGVGKPGEVCCAPRHIPLPQHLREAPRSIRRAAL